MSANREKKQNTVVAPSIIPEIKPCPLDPAEITGEGDGVKNSTLNVSRKDKFFLVITIPCCLRSIDRKCARECGFVDSDTIQYRVFGANIPAINRPSISRAWDGKTVKFSGNGIDPYDPVVVNYTIDNQFNNYNFLVKWLECQGCSMLDYQTTITMFALDEYNRQVAQWTMFGAFPTTVGDIQFNYRDTEELESSFTFEFSKLNFELM